LNIYHIYLIAYWIVYHWFSWTNQVYVFNFQQFVYGAYTHVTNHHNNNINNTTHKQKRKQEQKEKPLVINMNYLYEILRQDFSGNFRGTNVIKTLKGKWNK